MADEPNETSSSSAKSSTGKKRLPAISIPPRAAAEALFVGIKSPGPMTMLSNFFSDNLADGGSCGEVRSFSQLLAGAMASPSPTALGSWSLIFGDESSGEAAIAAGSSNPGNGDKLGSSSSSSVFKQNRPSSLMVPVSPLLAASPAFSPSVFLNSPSFFSPTLSPFGMSHQQALAQVTAQAVLNQGGYQAPSSVAEHIDPLTSYQSSAFNGHLPLSIKDEAVESVEDPHFDKIRTQNPPLAVGKPTNDGYNWRKYGQKQVKGSEFPRSYYRCTNSSCPVKKKVERSLDGHITEIIYKGQHNHEPPQKGKNVKEGASAKALAIAQQSDSQCSNGTSFPHSNLGGDEDSMQATSIQLNGPSDSEESGEGIQRIDEDDNDVEPKSKKRNIKAGTSDVALSHKTVTESKIIVQTRSEVDLLDDGYRWRKYGQKVVKGNPNPRSYYKCTTMGCGVRKHIERSHTDPKAVITTYEGKHIHDIPAGRGSKAKKCLKQLMDTATGSSAYD